MRRRSASCFPTGALIDGELVAVVNADTGVQQSFGALGGIWTQGAVAAGADVRLVAFDLLELAGERLDALPWTVRRAAPATYAPRYAA